MIPKQIQLAGFTIKIELVDDLYKKKQRIAEADYANHRIVIDRTMIPIAGMRQSYYHELMHYVFFILNEDELRTNEKLIDTIAHLLHQAHQKNECYTAEELKP